MPSGDFPVKTSIAHRSEFVTVTTPRGTIEVARQQRRGHRPGSGWRWIWVARRKGKVDWLDADTALDAIRKATLVRAGKRFPWLLEVAKQAEIEVERQESAGTADS